MSTITDYTYCLTMYIFVGDETNKEQSEQSVFFIYGGIVIHSDSVLEATQKIASIRDKHGFLDTDSLKFDTNSRPEQRVSPEEHKAAKNEVLKLCDTFGIKFMAYAVHHSIAHYPPDDKRNRYALNTLFRGYDEFLERKNSYGICLIDHFNKCLGILGSIHSEGIDPRLKTDETRQKLEHICCYGAININTTHLTSIVDIVVGAFRYCVNDKLNHEVVKTLLNKVRPLIICSDDNREEIEGYGLFLSPVVVEVPWHRNDYDKLRSKLKTLYHS